jgi:hypothetical protein
MRRLTAGLLLTLAACLPATAQDADLRFTGKRYPIDASIKFSAALLHWVDSLADLRGLGLSGGKTVPIHRETYRRTFGLPDEGERRMLEIYGDIRRRYAAHEDTARARALLLAFLEAPDMDGALDRARELLDPVDFVELRRILFRFSPPARDAAGGDARLLRDGSLCAAAAAPRARAGGRPRRHPRPGGRPPAAGGVAAAGPARRDRERDRARKRALPVPQLRPEDP